MQEVDEFLHLMKLGSQQQSGDYAPFAYGHIANYDPATHRVKVLLVSTRNDDDVPTLSGWMTLGGMGGNGWGIQIAPKGGASVNNPTAGELVVVQRLDRGFGAQAVACMVWNQVNLPPFPALAPGAVGIQSVGSSGGASIVLDPEGNCTINTHGNVTITAVGNMVLQAASIALQMAGGTLQKLVTSAFMALFNEHTHPGNGDPPDQQMTNAQLTATVQAE